MVQIIAGRKGKGKTKHLLDMANNGIKAATGSIVYLDKSSKHMYELNNRIRLINVNEYPVSTSQGFIGFICGIISQDHDIDKVQFISAKRSEKNAMLTLRVKLIYDKKSKLDNRSAISLAQNDVASPAGFGWDSAHPGTASWNAEESARYYQIQLVRNGIDTGIMRSVYKNHYDFSSQMTEPGEYCFRVRTVRQSSHNKSEWVTSEIWTVAAAENEENRSDVVNAGTE